MAAHQPSPISKRVVLPLAGRWFLLAFLLATLSSARASIVTYDITILFMFGPEAGAQGTGQVRYDTSLVQRTSGFTFVAPGGLGLLTLEMEVLGQVLTLANAVNRPNMPILYLDAVSLEPGSFLLWGAWGNTTTLDGPGFLFDRSIEYSTFAHSYYARREADGHSAVGTMPGPGSQTTGGIVMFAPAIPEPPTLALCVLAMLVAGARLRSI